MKDDVSKYGLDLHCTMILEEYRENMPVFEKMKEIAIGNLSKSISSTGLFIDSMESRIKTEQSLAGKLELKGAKYSSLSDITDILGARIITFYSDDVDKVSALVDKIFEIDWKNSVDKRKQHELDSFGYNSLHYICRIPKSLYFDPEMPRINEYWFEVQMRTALQHVWATMYHDTGYKSGIEIPLEHLRNLNRLAGMLELADEQFSIIRTSINNYRREVQGLVSDGKFDLVKLDGDTFQNYLKLGPFDKLNRKIAAINQAEIHQTSLYPYLTVLKDLGFKTLGDIENMIKTCWDDAYQLAVFQIGNTDIDIISSTVAIQDLCMVYILKQGGGVAGLKWMFDMVNGESNGNLERAERVLETAKQLSFMNK